MQNAVQEESIDAAALQAEFDSLYIPPNIDPHLLALWVEREQNKIERAKKKQAPQRYKQIGCRLTRLFPAYIGISVMCLAIILGLLQCQETQAILQMACVVFLAYTCLGLFAGLIAERCVNDSVETLLRDIVHRSREAGQNVETSNAATSIAE